MPNINCNRQDNGFDWWGLLLGQRGGGVRCPQASTGFDFIPPTSVGVGWVMECTFGGLHWVPTHYLQGNSLQVLEDIPLIEGDVPSHLLHQLHNPHHERAVILGGLAV